MAEEFINYLKGYLDGKSNGLSKEDVDYLKEKIEQIQKSYPNFPLTPYPIPNQWEKNYPHWDYTIFCSYEKH